MPILPNAVLPGNAQNGSFGSLVGDAVGASVLGAIGLSKASGRVNIADFYKYSSNTVGPNPAIIYPNTEQDWRVRLSLAPNSNYFYNDPQNTLLRPLISETGGGSTSGFGSAILGLQNSQGKSAWQSRIGVIFPYTPQVSITHSAKYSEQELTHSNYKNYFYNYSEVSAITITGDFTVQNINEGQYLMACVYFFRSITKMFFGGNDAMAGNPPPMVYLNGYGQYYLPNVPCVVTSFQHTMPADVDYMDVPEPAVTRRGYNPQFTNYRLNSTRLPTTSSVTISLQPVYSRRAQSQGFSLNDFAKGALANKPGLNSRVTGFGASQPANNGGKAGAGGFI
jgi:hypothetical protein